MKFLLLLDNGKFPVYGDTALIQNIWILFGRTFNNEGFISSMALKSLDGVIAPLEPTRSKRNILFQLLIRRSLPSSIGGKYGIPISGPRSARFYSYYLTSVFSPGIIFSNVELMDLHVVSMQHAP